MAQCVVDKRPSGGGASLGEAPVAGETRVIKEGSSGILWVGSASTVHKLTSGGNEELTVSPGDTVNDIAVDKDGLIWVAAGSDAKRYATGGGLQKTITPGGTVKALAADPLQSVIWIGAGNNVYKYDFDGTQLAPFTASDTVNALMRRSDGTIWVGAGSTVYKLAAGGSLIASFSAEAIVTDILEDDSGSIWVAAGSTVKKYAPAANGTVLETISPGFPVRDIDLDTAGPIWVAAGNSAWKYSIGGSLLVHVDEDGPVTALCVTSTGPVWIGFCRPVPSINVSPTSLNFYNVVEGNPSSKEFHITNTGTAPLNFSISSDNPLFTATPSSGTINPSGDQTINVTFFPPTGTPAGHQDGRLTITHNDPNQPDKTVELDADVVAATRIINVFPSTLDYANVRVNFSFTKVFTAKNDGNSTITVNNISSDNPRFQVNPNAFNLSPGEEKLVEVTFSPINTGMQNGQLSFNSNATNIIPPFSLTGTGILAPSVDAYLVLDRSGSMSESAGSGLTKMGRLFSAADLFIDLTQPDQGDKMGVVQFDYPTTDYVAHLSTITASSKTTMKHAIRELIPSGWTSIGQGLNLAFSELTDPSSSTANRRVLLLVSDGKENRPPFVDIANGTPTISIPTQPNIAIYTVGLGLAENMNTTLLSDLAFNSVGTVKGFFHLTQDNWYKLHKFFISIFSDTFDEYVILDPVYSLGPEETVTIPTTIVDSDKSVTFVIYWTNRESQLLLELLSPDGTTITPKTAKKLGVQYTIGDLYAFCRVSFLPGSKWVNKKKGVWTLKVTGTNIPAGVDKEILSISVLAASDLSFNPFLNKGNYTTGDVILLGVELFERGRPIEADQVTVTITKPNEGLGNILSTHKISERDLKTSLRLGVDISQNPKFKKVSILQHKLGRPVVSYGKDTIPLFDDGLHGDGAACDGKWTNMYTNTGIEGVYTFHFRASIRSRSGELTTREKVLSATVAINRIDPSQTIISIDRIPADRLGFVGYKVKIIPKDAFGSFLGPGYANLASLEAEGVGFADSVKDNGNGEYSQNLYIPSSSDVNEIVLQIGFFESQICLNLGEKLRQQSIWVRLMNLFRSFFYALLRIRRT